MEESEVREILAKKGFTKIRKKYGQRYEPIISADKKGMRIWVHMKHGEYQTAKHDGKTIQRNHGNITGLKDL